MAEVRNIDDFPSFPLADLHAHLSASIHPGIYWQIAHSQGFKLPQKDYHDFEAAITLHPGKERSMKEYFDTIYHPLLDKLSSGTLAVERATYEIMSGAYRSNNITLIELRNNPMKHNHEGQEDLDHIIMAMLRGMERALLEYERLSAGLIFCLDRQFTHEMNSAIVEKAIKYHKRGVVGIDFANYNTDSFHFRDYSALIERAVQYGLHVTVHSGETPDTNDIWEALEFVRPQRIGHGIKAAYDNALMKELAKRDVVLEVCPFSNLMTKAVENIDELSFILRTFIEQKVRFCINTDWPEMIRGAHLKSQFQFLLANKLLSKEELEECNRKAFASTFIPGAGLGSYL